MADADKIVPFTPQELERINAAIQEHAGGYKPCWSCGKTTWAVMPGIVNLGIQARSPGAPQPGTFGTSSTPNLALICTTCGYTVLLNILVLKLGDLFGVISVTDHEAQQQAAAKPAAAEPQAPTESDAGSVLG